MKILARVLPIVALGAFVMGAVLADRELSPPPPVPFGTATIPPMPVLASGQPLSSSWYCPGVPASADAAAGTGSVSVLNPGDTAIEGSITVYPSEGDPVTAPLNVAQERRVEIRLGDLVAAPWAGAVVEILGAEGVVEQVVNSPTGRSSTACSNTAGTTWYLADGATTVDASLGVLLFNPFPDDAILDLSFATSEGTRKPQPTQGFVVRGQSVRLLVLDDIVRREATIATTVIARSGRVVVGKAQTYTQGTKRSFAVGLGAPAAAEQWWFATGQKGAPAVERVTVFNPGEAEAAVSIAFYPADPSATAVDANVPIDVAVPPGAAINVDVSNNGGLADGQHSILVLSEPSRPVVAERVLELQGDAATNVTQQLGSPLTSTVWTFVTGAPGGAEALVVANSTGEAATVTVRTVGPAGFSPVTGLEALALPAAGTIRVDLDERGLAGQPLVVESTLEVVAERIIGAPVGQAGLSVSLGVPSVA